MASDACSSCVSLENGSCPGWDPECPECETTVHRAETAWGEAFESVDSWEMDVGGFPVSGEFVLANGNVVGHWGPTAEECFVVFPDGRREQF